jgi:alkyl sulfatase BDS1-like metallo-beta-lactamase superfamily hydrolase
LTEYGAGLKEALYALARWGARTIAPPGPDDELYPEWGMNALPALFNAEAAHGRTETYVLVVDGDAFTARVVSGALDPSMGAAEDADVVVEVDMETFFALASGELAPRDAVKSGRAKVEGNVEALERCFRVLSFAPRVATAA